MSFKTYLFIFTIFKLVFSHDKPNIVIIIADDLGWNDVGFHGSNQLPTPNIDALAYNGIILNRFYTQQCCTPSRAALLTGKYPIRTGLQGEPLSVGQNFSLPLNSELLPQKLKELGYGTYLVGKWHLGYTHKSVTPTKRGFDKHFGYWNPYIDYFKYRSNRLDMDGFDLRDNFKVSREYQGIYATDLFTQKATEFIKEHDTKQPMFLMLSHLAPHTGPDGSVAVKNTTETNLKFNYIDDIQRRIYADAVNKIDESLGNIVEALDEKKILDNTIILFLSDNGAPSLGGHSNNGSNWPLRGIKMFYFEGGVRGTAVLWGSRLRGNAINNELFHITDIMPTFYAAAGGNVSNLDSIDGINQWNSLYNSEEGPRTELLINIDELAGHSAFISRSGQYKLVNGSTTYQNYYGETGRSVKDHQYDVSTIFQSKVHGAFQKYKSFELSEKAVLKTRSQLDLSNCRLENETPEVNCSSLCLFDLFEDPCEKRDIKDEHEDVVVEISAKLLKYWESLLPQPKKYIDPRANPMYFNDTWDTWLENNCLANPITDPWCQ